MKKSLIRLLLFSIIPLAVIIFSIELLGKHTDNFYRRFTSPKQNSLILGSSRAAFTDPAIIDDIVNKKFPAAKLYNYAFTYAHSPYGPKYLESIEKKLEKNSKDGLFIVTIEPTAVMVSKEFPDDPKYFIENDKSVARTSCVSCNPNLEYLFESYDFSITTELNKKILREKNKVADVDILKNGKLQVKILKTFPDKKLKELHISNMKTFTERLQGLKVSEVRLNYLAKTLKFLQKHGTVIVVRLPISEIPYDIERTYFSNFDARIQEICNSQNIFFKNYNLEKEHYQYTDDVHLTPEQNNIFSKNLAEDILLYAK